MPKASEILGMNARQQKYALMNSSAAKKYAASKILAKDMLVENDIPVPKLYAKFSNMSQVYDFDWDAVTTSFVIKPIDGNAGKGILIIRKKSDKKDIWLNHDNQEISTKDLIYHINNILEGEYSTYGSDRVAFVEERVPIHPKFRKYAYRGTPDIRVIVYNSIPVMGMLRIPTKESEGKANLHMGAIGIGVDIATGVTLKGLCNNEVISFLPNTKKKLNGIKIPKWTKLLEVAVAAANASGLRYCGVDILLHEERGPLVVELNANPGLSIQVANNAGLRKRLERVEGLEIKNAQHGVKVGKALFAEWFADKVKADEGFAIVDAFEQVLVKHPTEKQEWTEVEGKVATGRLRSVIDRSLAKEIGILEADNYLWFRKRHAEDESKKHPVIEVKIKLKDKVIATTAYVEDRSDYSTKFVVGRQDLEGFLINPNTQ